MAELKAPARPRSPVQTMSRCLSSEPVPASSFGAPGWPTTAAARLPRTRFMRSANGRAASADCWARRNLAAATICMALVIFCVAFTEAIRFLRSFRLAMACASSTPRLGEGLGEGLDGALQLPGEVVGKIPAVANAAQDIGVLGPQRREQAILEGADAVHWHRIEIAV